MSAYKYVPGCGFATNSTGHSFLVVAGGLNTEFIVEIYYPGSSEWINLSS